jgi:hypothetical protein
VYALKDEVQELRQVRQLLSNLYNGWEIKENAVLQMKLGVASTGSGVQTPALAQQQQQPQIKRKRNSLSINKEITERKSCLRIPRHTAIGLP